MAITTQQRATLREYLSTAKAITWDTCHKIYVLMDDKQVELMRSYGYDEIITSEQQTPKKMSATISKWFADSCELRFVYAVETKPEANAGFYTIVAQR